VQSQIEELQKRIEMLETLVATFRSLVEITSDFIWEVDQEMIFTYASPNVTDILGYEPGEVVGKRPFDFMLPDETGRLAGWVQDRFEQKKSFAVLEAVHQHKDGRRVVLETSGVPILDGEGNLLGFRGIGRDISKRKQAEQNMLESERKFRALFESSNDAVMLLDKDGFLDCNDATLHIFGCSTRAEFVGKHPSELSPRTQPNGTSSLKAAEAKIALAIETGRAHFEWLHRRIDGSEFMADVLLSSMDLKGKTVLQAVVRDIDEKKRAEKAILRERTTLRRLLESSDRDRKLMAYEIHDGLTQHIVGAKMQFETIMHLLDENPEEAAKGIDRGMNSLNQGIGEARRLISGLRPPILDEVGVVAAIQHLVHDVSEQDGPKPEFVADVGCGRLEPLLENAIFRIVQESLANARQHSKSDRVQVQLTQREGQILIEVRDWGIGFDPEDVAETCFGLRGIQERARLLGGRTTIDSAAEKGTRIIAALPLVESEETKPGGR